MQKKQLSDFAETQNLKNGLPLWKQATMRNWPNSNTSSTSSSRIHLIHFKSRDKCINCFMFHSYSNSYTNDKCIPVKSGLRQIM